MEIRTIKLEDLDNVYELLNELYENEIEYDNFTNKYKDSLIDNKCYGIVATNENKIIGVLIARVISRLAKKNNILFIDDLIVNKMYRNTGVGRQLIQTATTYAISNNCNSIELTSMLNNTNAHRFYENNGFEKRQYKFKKHLN